MKGFGLVIVEYVFEEIGGVSNRDLFQEIAGEMVDVVCGRI